ncbi:Holliday junction resolvase RecU [Lactobacillus selangorensis]|uniref:Holliday junction resolvase RecU n=1 Tax=Lactobacillus selangorensis TaxID=81857 RepID=UPI000709DE26|nr:Holliday junction resolvase RecU [Lactobacillus selangorensis]
MTFHYPNGQPYLHHEAKKAKKQAASATTIFGKRGMSLEEELNESNQYYLAKEIAVVHKKPTPIQIVKVDYPQRSQAVIKEAYFKRPSTTDYNGVYHGHYIDFDAKETKSKTSFPLHNFHEHQVKHMDECLKQGGICFALIRFVVLDRIFVYPASNLITFWRAQMTGGRKSIPLDAVVADGVEINYQLNPLIPYLDGVDELIARTQQGGN